MGSPFFLPIKCIFSIMPSQRKASKKSLTRLRELCDQLSDRDDQLKKDLQLFEGFFSTFPIPVTMWSIGKDHRVLSVRGEGYTCSKASTLEEMFECDHLRNQSVDKHELALAGEVVTFFVESNDCVYWTKLVPRENDKGESIGVIGMAWDVTSNAIMIHCLEEIIKMVEAKEAYSKILPIAKRGLSVSRLKKLLEEKEKDDG